MFFTRNLENNFPKILARLNLKLYFRLQAMKDDLEKHHASLKDSQALAEKLLSDSEDPIAAAELESRLSRADLELKKLSDKIEARENQLQAALAQCDQFEADSDIFLRWLTKTERTFAKLRPISADAGTVREQKDSFQVGMSIILSSLQ